jgi:hypothetical protein
LAILLPKALANFQWSGKEEVYMEQSYVRNNNSIGCVYKVYQLLAHGRLFSPGTPASSTTKTGRHDIAEILLKVALNTKKTNQNHHIRASSGEH